MHGRRKMLKQSALLSLGSLWASGLLAGGFNGHRPSRRNNLKLSLNAYSFNAPLTKGELSLDDLFLFCAQKGLPAVDLTAYYIAGYPNVPKDKDLFQIKLNAHTYGLDISGTGIRNDFTWLDRARGKEEVQLVKDWAVAAAKIGAPVLRVFSGTQKVALSDRESVMKWMIDDFRDCADFAKDHGVIIALQNHSDFIQTADEVDRIINEVGSPWFKLVLDIGSYSQEDPYEGIKQNISHAVNWQIKEKVNHFGVEKPVDLDRLFGIIAESGYNGYLPIETLGPGDPFQKVSSFLESVRTSMKRLV